MPKSDNKKRAHAPRGDGYGDPGDQQMRHPNVSPRIDHEDPVEDASDASFPASDPPSFTPAKVGAPHAAPNEEVEREQPSGGADRESIERVEDGGRDEVERERD